MKLKFHLIEFKQFTTVKAISKHTLLNFDFERQAKNCNKNNREQSLEPTEMG